MAKKQAKTRRVVSLPDWADDVTPTDEVMKKFYAPTGTFKRGPIAFPAHTSNVPSSAPSVEPGASVHDEQNESASLREQVVVSRAEARLTENPSQTEGASVFRVPAASKEASSDSHLSRRNDSDRRSAPVKLNSPGEPEPVRPSADAQTSLSDDTQQSPNTISNADFDVFAEKWKRYLYPGQLAVMRVLLELTSAHDSSECFTRYSEIASATRMSRRNCINVINSLADRGFVERIEIRNDAAAKGIRLKVKTNPS